MRDDIIVLPRLDDMMMMHAHFRRGRRMLFDTTIYMRKKSDFGLKHYFALMNTDII